MIVRRGTGILLTALLCACALAIFSEHVRHSANALPLYTSEIPMLRLERRDGKLFRYNSQTPFTGTMVDYYSNGALKSRSALVNGVLNGRSEGFFRNGSPEVVEFFQAGTSHGLRTVWHQNGQLLSKGELIQGKQHGIFRRWHENGKPETEAEFSDGKPHGLSRSWYASGFLKAEAIMVFGEVKERHSYSDGERHEAVLLAQTNLQ
jgi:antitoxin component YwqK of YwqJK toxin-antitoxin module